MRGLETDFLLDDKEVPDSSFCEQNVNELIPGTQETKWFEYTSFEALPALYPASDKLKAFGVTVDKLDTLWD